MKKKKIENLQIKIVKCVGAKAQREKCVGTLQKQTMGIIFNIQNSRIHGQNQPVESLPVANFRSRPREKFHHQSPWIRIFRLFFLHFGSLPFLGKFERHCLQDGEGFADLSSTWPTGAKCDWSVSSWLAISNTRKKIRYFFTCAFTAFLKVRNPCITP